MCLRLDVVLRSPMCSFYLIVLISEPTAFLPWTDPDLQYVLCKVALGAGTILGVQGSLERGYESGPAGTVPFQSITMPDLAATGRTCRARLT
jgi:hypothetical protein